MDVSGYSLERLREDAEIVLYRGRRPGDAATVLVVAPASGRPEMGSFRRIEHEYALAADLDPAWAARPLALATYAGRPVLVLEDAGGEPLDAAPGRPLQLEHFLTIAVGLAAAVGQVHRRGLIHKDIKPANVLVDAAGTVRLTGFGIASRLPRERQALASPAVIAGTLAYMAPEQTGRMNRSIDTRSDLYALGVTLYELLTGQLPFMASDAMEWIHCHIARRPIPPSERVDGIPAAVEAIVLKLVAKMAEDRYQTAAGVEHDLKSCLAAWQADGAVEPFALGARDWSDRLLIPEKLYGREAEVGTLVASFNRVVIHGQTELVLVSGNAGVGKSAIVNELHRVLVPSRGLFAAGKFDQFKREIPYATLAQAFRSLVRQLLGADDAELSRWRHELLGALGASAGLIVNLIPEVALIIGEQPPVPDLPPLDAQRRFQLVFRRFLGVFARPEHPLTLFLDDLQWLDMATLDLLHHLVTEPEVQHLLLIGAYRDNEVGRSHPLARMLAAIRNGGGRMCEVVLAPLAADDMAALIADALHAQRTEVGPLAGLVFEKTGGNPFFAIQFIIMLADENLLALDSKASTWGWDMGRIRSKRVADNVADLMAAKLSRLSDTTQEVLAELACLGDAATTSTVALVQGSSEEVVDAALWPAVRAGLVLRVDGANAFTHDRIQEAAYGLVAEHERSAAHLRIGRLLISRTLPAELEETIFEIVNQLDRGAVLIDTPQEREQVAALNLTAGRRAKTSTAYTAALAYLVAGRALLADDSWQRQYRLTFDLESNRAECEFLTGDLKAAEERLSMLSGRAADLPDKAAVTCLRVALYTTLDQSDRAVEVCLDYLQGAGLAFSKHPGNEQVQEEYDRFRERIGSRSIESIIELPLVSDPNWRAIMDVLTEVIPAASYTDENLLGVVLLSMAGLSLEHGNSDGSCFAYSCLYLVVQERFGDYETGYRFGKLSFDLVEDRGLNRFKARVYMCFATLIPWTRHLSGIRGLLRRAFDAALETGDLTFASYSHFNLVSYGLFCGDRLDELQREAETGLAFVQQARFGMVVDMLTGFHRLARTLRGLTPSLASFNDAEFDEVAFERHLQQDARLFVAMRSYCIRKLQSRYLAGDYAAAIDAAAQAEGPLWATSSYFELVEFSFYAALAHAASADSDNGSERTRHMAALLEHQRKLAAIAEMVPENAGSRATLVAAEIARLEGRELAAMRLHEQAIGAARAQGFVQIEAIGNELAARFHATLGVETVADAYLRNARSCFVRWGADGKVRQLEEDHPRLRVKLPSPGSGSAIRTSVEQLDLANIVKVSQAVSSEIDLKKLIDTLMVIALEHSGGDRALLILPRSDGLLIEAEATSVADKIEVDLRTAPVTATDLPESVLRYVVRTRDSVLLDDAAELNSFSEDAYIQAAHPRSILCLPLVKQKRITGVLYLENNQASHVFTQHRLAVLSLLSSQAAISLENARLYLDIQQTLQKSRQTENELRLSIDLIPTLAWSSQPDGTFDFANKRWHDYTGIPHDAARAGEWIHGFHPDDIAKVFGKWQELLATGVEGEVEARMLRFDGVSRTFLVRATPLRDGLGNIIKWYGTNTDIDELKRADQLVAEEKRLLEMAGAGNSLPVILDALCLVLEKFIEGSLASVLLLDPDSKSLRHCAAPSLPSSYVEAIDGSSIGPAAGSCGTAAYRQQPVFVSDIAADPLWADYRDLALKHGLRSCWSTPVLSFEGAVLGTFAVYSRQVRHVTPQELNVTEQFNRLTSIIIQRKQAEDSLRKSETLLADGERISRTGSWTWNAATNLVSWSVECARIFGFGPDVRTIPHASIMQRVHPADRELVVAAYRDAMPTRSDVNFEHRIVLPDGAETVVQSRGRVVLNSAGEISEFVGTVLDVTEQRAREGEMRRLVSLIENSTECIGYARSPLEAMYINDAWRRLAGLEPDANPDDLKMSDLLPAEDYDFFIQEIVPTLSRDGHWEGERALQHVKTRQAIPVHQTNFFITEAGTDRRIGIATICRDITERKRIDRNLQTSLEEKDALLKEVHHRVKNNLQLISSLLNLQGGRIADPDVAELLFESRNRVRSMALVHENLYRAGNFARVPMRPHVQNLCAHLIRAYSPHGQHVELTTAVDEVELDLDRAVSAGLIINELVSNALKHAFPDGRRGHVRVELKLPGEGRCVLAVTDDGVGLPLALDEDRADTLGLQLVHDLTRQLHGLVAVSRDGGTTFTISFDADQHG
jgi:PAS domain S-box-containing protein